MALAKLVIIKEKRNAVMSFDGGSRITAQYNPASLKISKSVQWKSESAKGRDVPESQFQNGVPRVLSVELIFDSYDNSTLSDDSVAPVVEDIFHLTTVEKHGDKHRPPVCKVVWGRFSFVGVLEKFEEELLLFKEDGTPVRAKVVCSFKEWRTNYDDATAAATESADVTKSRLLQRGQTLSGLAADEYMDPRKWREIANANNIDDPFRITAGTTLIIPSLTNNRSR